MTQEALKLALEALEVATTPLAKDRQEVLRAITAIKEALAQTQEPVAWMDADGNVSDNNDHKCFPIPLYTLPPQRTEPVCPECKAEVLYECVACSSNNYPPQRTEPLIGCVNHDCEKCKAQKACVSCGQLVVKENK